MEDLQKILAADVEKETQKNNQTAKRLLHLEEESSTWNFYRYRIRCVCGQDSVTDG
ncbi:rCG61321, isoform CRA_b [Rattus norvegicus]|uniref:RCG61321, isoform CRA_b n=1 Tax=Rattus norvegicus TaxID=10116 RepID=A6HC09_RAT|nr:rCG61321, isoform CRA_b [Rattus norvegicus]